MLPYRYSLQELKNKAEKLAAEAISPFSVLLFGDLGRGKTTFAQFFIKSLLINKTQNITSPTFNIVQVYETTKGPIWHVDLFRLKNKEEIFGLALLEAMNNNICLIEWPEFLKEYIQNYNAISVKL
ncbi:hypothetical protein FACS1894113_2120 [Alphaproteobacteria bacterium]|nr:hypothetical protein FACS1894113_2120 [Alphaproteobacteria bacterium]